MNFFAQKEVKKLLKNKGIKPKKQLGQNFLIEKNIVEKIITAADVKGNDIVLEVGAGIGVLTQSLAKKAKKVIAVEKDKNLVELLKNRLKGFKNIGIISGDILKINIEKLIGKEKYILVANIPYYITAPFIDKFLKSSLKPKTMVLMLQKEVAQRICSDPPKMNRLAVLAQFYASPEIIQIISKNSFWPKPKIDSAVLKLKIKKDRQQLKSKLFEEKFFKVVKIGFSHPRKQIINNLKNGFNLSFEQTINVLKLAKVPAKKRAENLSLKDWTKITLNFKL